MPLSVTRQGDYVPHQQSTNRFRPVAKKEVSNDRSVEGQGPMRSGGRDRDDLKLIKGIGAARQQWLRKSLGVRTLRDLAALSADEIASRLKAEGHVISRGEIDRWIALAQEHAAEARAKANTPAAEGKWKPFASFVVEFQARKVEGRAEEQRTTVHYMEADKGETWPTMEAERALRWILEQLGERVQQEPKQEPPAAARAPAPTPVTIQITHIQAFQPPETESPIGVGEAGRPFSGLVGGGKPFALEASFSLAGSTAADLAKKNVKYLAQFHARSLVTGATIHLGDTDPNVLLEGKSVYSAMLPQATLPPGVYRLRTLVTLQVARAIPGYLEVPMLRVV